MKKSLVFILALVVVNLFSETIILNDGRELEGEIVGKKGKSIFFQNETMKYQIFKNEIKTIKNNAGATITNKTYKKVDWRIADTGDYEVIGSPVAKKKARKRNYNNKHFNWDMKVNPVPLGVAVITGYLAFENFDDVFYYNTKGSNPHFRDRAWAGGILFTLATATNLYFSFEKVEITATDKTIGLSYKF